MYSYTILALASLASAAIMPGGSQFSPNNIQRRNETITTTKVVAAYTTYCPEPTTFELGGKKYEVTEPTTLTITDCPCTIVEPCYTCGPNPTGTAAPPNPSPPNPSPPGPNPVPEESSALPVPPGTTAAPTEAPEQPTTPPVMTAAAGHNGVALVGAAVFGLLAL